MSMTIVKAFFNSLPIFSLLNIVFVISLIGMFLPVFGLVPRLFIFLPALSLLLYILFASYEDSVLLFVRFIPFFFALPLTQAFDNFNLWRIAVLILFLRWFLIERPFDGVFAFQETKQYDSTYSYVRGSLQYIWGKKRAEVLGIAIFAFAFLSLLVAQDIFAGLRRIIYFVNLTLLCVVVRHLVFTKKDYLVKLAGSFFLSGAFVILVGFFQWVSTYLVPASAFHFWWGQVVSLGMYGARWADIVTNFGNTWFSYSGGGLRLRMFSLFPDSHSFPLYLLMVLPFLFFLLFIYQKKAGKERTLLGIAFVLLHLALILSGTRGIWVSIIFPAFALAIAWWRFENLASLTKKIALSLLIFVVMFPVAWGIIFIPQFKEEAVGSSGILLVKRLRSIIDIEETSNKGRIAIWKKTIASINAHPLLGVGIGNYAVILGENISAEKAGASAHNLFLHIAAIMGIGGLLVFMWFFWEVMKRGFSLLRNTAMAQEYQIFSYASLFALIWMLGYSLTDVALFDERAFLGFMVLLGALLGLREKTT